MPNNSNGNTVKRAVLLVDDDISSRMPTADALRGTGDLQVIEANRPTAAHRVLKARDDIDVVVINFTLSPAKDAAELAKRARETKPNVRILIAADSPESIDPATLFQCKIQTLLKPYGIPELVQRVENLISRPAR